MGKDCFATIKINLKHLYYKTKIKKGKLILFFDNDYSFHKAETYLIEKYSFSMQVEADTVNKNKRGIALTLS